MLPYGAQPSTSSVCLEVFGAASLRNSDGFPWPYCDDAPKDENEAEDANCNGLGNPNTFCVGDRANGKWEHGWKDMTNFLQNKEFYIPAPMDPAEELET